MMHRHKRHGRVYRVIIERDLFSHPADGRNRVTPPLRAHGLRRLECQHVPVAGLIGPRAGSFVEDRPGLTKRLVHTKCDPWVGPAASSEPVVPFVS